MDDESIGSPLSDARSSSSPYSSGNDHCYDSYYSVYNESEQEYFADDNPLSQDRNEESHTRKFSGALGDRIERSLDVGTDDEDELDDLSGAPLKLKLMEFHKIGIEVNTDRLDSIDVGWYKRYIEQHEMAAKMNSSVATITTDESDMSTRLTTPRSATACKNLLSPHSPHSNIIENDPPQGVSDIQIQLWETQKELLAAQLRVAALEAEKLLRVPVLIPPVIIVKDTSCRLYLPESESPTGKIPHFISSEYKEVDFSVFDATNSADTESLCDILSQSPGSVFSVNPEGRTPLHLACMTNHHMLALLLIQHGAVLNAADAAGQTPLHLCTDSAMIHLLCQRGANSHIRDNHGFTPLYVHTLHCREELVQSLLEHDADPMMLDPVSRRNVLHCAADMGNYNIISMLVMLHTSDRFLDAQDVNGDTALHIIVTHRAETLDEKYHSIPKVQGLSIQKCLMLMLNRGAKVNIKNNSHATPLHLVCANRHLRATVSTAPLVEILLSMHADPNARDMDGCTPLMVSAVYGDWEVTELLVRTGGDLNAVCAITSQYLLNNRKDFYCGSESEYLMKSTCAPSDIIPKSTLDSLYRHISAPQTAIKKGDQMRCVECRESYTLNESGESSSYLMSFLGLEAEGGMRSVSSSMHGEKLFSNTSNNCGHCGRYLCQNCLPNSLLGVCMPAFYQNSPKRSPKSQGFPFYDLSSESVKLCGICHEILVK